MTSITVLGLEFRIISWGLSKKKEKEEIKIKKKEKKEKEEKKKKVRGQCLNY